MQSDGNNAAEDLVLNHTNKQCEDVEDWRNKAFPLMIEDVDGGAPFPFTTLTVDDAKLLVNLLTKPLRLLTEKGVIMSPPITDDSPALAMLARWAKAASTQIESLRSKK